jgi:uncharacterized protein YdiU (UPF0061 family)
LQSLRGTAIRADDLPLDNSFAELPPAFYTRLMPTPLPRRISSRPAPKRRPGPASTRPTWRTRISSPSSAATSCRRAPPLAAVYSGHQFGHWAGQLGDGRAILLGELRGPKVRWSCS